MENSISIGLGEQVVTRSRDDILVAYGLGSCLGIGMFDPLRKIGGMLHAVLPERVNGNDPLRSKYVDSGIENLLEEMIKAGADRRNLIIRMAGGANMLLSTSLAKGFDIGTRNANIAFQTFDRLNLKLKSHEVGGNIGRTVRLYILTGRMTIRMIGGQERDI